MNVSRRRLLKLAGAAVVLPTGARLARAGAYPTRPVRILVGFAPGGGSDMAARFIAQWLSERLGQPFIVENRPGAGTNVATEAAANAPSDGHTLLLAGLPNASNATLYSNLRFDFLRDMAPVAGIQREPFVVVTNPSVPVKTIPEFISYANANRGSINMASAGIGSGTHLAAILFQTMTGVSLVHVPYRGAAPALTDLLGGQAQVMFAAASTAIGYVAAAKLQALAVTMTTPLPALPGTPTLAESVPGYEFSYWNGIAVRTGTPIEIIENLNRQINAALADPKFKARLGEFSGAPLFGSPTDFGQVIADETEKWRNVIRAAHIQPLT